MNCTPTVIPIWLDRLKHGSDICHLAVLRRPEIQTTQLPRSPTPLHPSPIPRLTLELLFYIIRASRGAFANAGEAQMEGIVRLPRRRRLDERLVFEIDPELANQLRMAAHASKQSAESYAEELLARGLEREDLRAQVRSILAALTPREEQVTRLTARGFTNRQIADALVVSIETVKTHVRHALEKLGVRSKTELRLLLLDMDIRWWVLREE